jgi:hypothetical protein
MKKLTLLFISSLALAASAFGATQQDVDSAVKSEVEQIGCEIGVSMKKELSDSNAVKKMNRKLAWSGFTAPKPIVKFAEGTGAKAMLFTLKDFAEGAKKTDLEKKINDLITADGPDNQLKKLWSLRKKFHKDATTVGHKFADQLLTEALQAGIAAGRVVLESHKNGTMPKTEKELNEWSTRVAETEAKTALQRSVASK